MARTARTIDTASDGGALRVEPVGPQHDDDLQRLFGSDPMVDACWCMWYVVRVADFHQQGRDGNRAAFLELQATSPEPLGVLAYRGDEPVGWCAAGPRSRYVRALKTPTLRGRDPAEDDDVWLVTCLFVKEGHRRGGVAAALIEGASALARARGACAIEGFPDAPGKRSERGARGAESTFEACGFTVVRRPSPARAIVRRELR